MDACVRLDFLLPGLLAGSKGGKGKAWSRRGVEKGLAPHEPMSLCCLSQDSPEAKTLLLCPSSPLQVTSAHHHVCSQLTAQRMPGKGSSWQDWIGAGDSGPRLGWAEGQWECVVSSCQQRQKPVDQHLSGCPRKGVKAVGHTIAFPDLKGNILQQTPGQS